MSYEHKYNKYKHKYYNLLHGGYAQKGGIGPPIVININSYGLDHPEHLGYIINKMNTSLLSLKHKEEYTLKEIPSLRSQNKNKREHQLMDRIITQFNKNVSKIKTGNFDTIEPVIFQELKLGGEKEKDEQLRNFFKLLAMQINAAFQEIMDSQKRGKFVRETDMMTEIEQLKKRDLDKPIFDILMDPKKQTTKKVNDMFDIKTKKIDAQIFEFRKEFIQTQQMLQNEISRIKDIKKTIKSDIMNDLEVTLDKIVAGNMEEFGKMCRESLIYNHIPGKRERNFILTGFPSRGSISVSARPSR